MQTDTLSAYDFDLPDDRIALRPATPRDSARLLYIPASKGFGDHRVHELPQFLRKGDMLVVNITKVIPARLTGIRKRNGGEDVKVEVTLTEKQTEEKNKVKWQCFLKPAKRVRVGDKILFGDTEAEVALRDGRTTEIIFNIAPHKMESTLAQLGAMPLPPYIAAKRAPDTQDESDYQTVFAKTAGAVAAPTAGLHFTPELLATLKQQGINIAELTLHIGAGTFLPVEVEDIATHKMHAEWGQITAATAAAINATRKNGGRIIAVGTTALRLLESAAQPDGTITPFTGVTDIFIAPNSENHHTIRTADMLLTNFHLPRSTLFMLVCAFSGYDKMRDAYAHAIKNNYRFFSYGDACLLERQNEV